MPWQLSSSTKLGSITMKSSSSAVAWILVLMLILDPNSAPISPSPRSCSFQPGQLLSAWLQRSASGRAGTSDHWCNLVTAALFASVTWTKSKEGRRILVTQSHVLHWSDRLHSPPARTLDTPSSMLFAIPGTLPVAQQAPLSCSRDTGTQCFPISILSQPFPNTAAHSKSAPPNTKSPYLHSLLRPKCLIPTSRPSNSEPSILHQARSQRLVPCLGCQNHSGNGLTRIVRF